MKKLNINVNGNKKLQNSDNVRFIIWNLPAVKTCPFRTPSCEKSCYARKAERVYPQVLPSREKNYSDSLEDDFTENMIYTLENELKSRKYNGKKVIFRIHESGDFYSKEYANKWVEIVKHFPDVTFVAYTKSAVFFPAYNSPVFPSNFVIRYSVWADTCVDMLLLAENQQFPIYTALTADDMEKERANGHVFAICKCDNCATCGLCWNKKAHDIICKIH